MDNDKIRIATSQPSLKNKVKTNLDGNTDAIYWYIRFNIPLDETTVSEKTMDVTDTEGYIMRTDITYNTKSHLIIISPLDTYEQNRFYLLNISKKVRSARGQNLRSHIHILFKLLDNQITDYQVIRKNVQVPKPKARPRDYDQRQIGRRPSAFEQAYMNRSPRDRMTTVNFNINIWLGLVGLAVVLTGLFLSILWLIIAGTLVCLGGLAHIYVQMRNRELSSTLAFNKGVRAFNKGLYREAGVSFQKALRINPKNELAQYGLYKVNLYDT